MQLTDEQIERLRQSGIRLDADGRFWHEGGEVTHAGMRAAFYRWLDRNDDGRWVLRLDERRFVYLDVDDAPFVVRSLRWEGDRARLRLSDDSEGELDPRTLRVGAAGRYVTLGRGFPAPPPTAAWNALAARLPQPAAGSRGGCRAGGATACGRRASAREPAARGSAPCRRTRSSRAAAPRSPPRRRAATLRRAAAWRRWRTRRRAGAARRSPRSRS